MLRFLIGRLLSTIPLLIVITAFVFILGQYGAGDMAAQLTMRGSNGKWDQALYERYRAELEMDKPVLVRYVNWLGKALQGDLGRSYVAVGQPKVTKVLAKGLPISMQLALAALVMVTFTAIPVGILTAFYHDTPLDRILVSSASVLSTIPSFVLAPVSMIVIVNQLHLLPSVGLGWHGLFSKETILPAACLAAGGFLNLVRFTRASVLEVLSQDYIRAARARGLSDWQVVLQHVIRNSLTPVITVLGLTAAGMVSGTLFIEAIFNIQGFGLATQQALNQGDIQTATGTTLVSTILLIAANLIVDLLYSVVDPRVRLS
jgi:peptide/nickel transport system permease protein